MVKQKPVDTGKTRRKTAKVTVELSRSEVEALDRVLGRIAAGGGKRISRKGLLQALLKATTKDPLEPEEMP